MKIKYVHENGLAKELDLQIDDELLEINNHPIRDILDLRFWSDENDTVLKISRNGQNIEYQIDGGLGDLSVEFTPMKFRCCGNKCIFCFIDQNPQGLRKSLYFKDEDFRLSFLHGNYVTLSNTSQSDLDRIVEQRLSPLYISVHTTNSLIRTRMFGRKRDDRLLYKINFLAQNKIEMHVQIVLCPGINDKNILDDTLITLSNYYPYIKTIAIVPVGLTKHRVGLPTIQPVDESYSSTFIDWAEDYSQRFKNKLGSYFVFLADEFYLSAKKAIPASARYEGFDQIENGVGMTRQFLDSFREEKQELPNQLPKSYKATIITGKLANPFISDTVAKKMNCIENLTVQVIAVPNKFFGESVTISGLLTGQDIYNELREFELGDILWLPPNCINYDGLFLDDWTLERLEEKLNTPVKIVSEGFSQAILELIGSY